MTVMPMRSCSNLALTSSDVTNLTILTRFIKVQLQNDHRLHEIYLRLSENGKKVADCLRGAPSDNEDVETLAKYLKEWNEKRV